MYRVLICTLFGHDPALLLLAAGICLASFYVTSLIWLHLETMCSSRKMPWYAGLGLVSGGGAWATHFVAMLAYKAPLPIQFDMTFTVASLMVGIAGHCAAFATLERTQRKNGILTAAALFASGVIALHFVGMAGIVAAARKSWAPGLIAASWLVCFAFAGAGMFAYKQLKTAYGRYLSGALLAVSVISLHFTAMGALTLVPDPTLPHVKSDLGAFGLSFAICIIVAVILIAVLLIIVTSNRLNLAEQQNRIKSQFLTTMSHELRTPLTSIMSHAELIAEVASEEGRACEEADAKIIIDASHQLLSLIAEILDFSKLEAKKMQMEVTSFCVAGLVASISQSVAPLMARNQNIFETTVEDDVGMMVSDMSRLRQCLLNLLSNAAKFTAKGAVTFKARTTILGGRPGVTFDVVDTGVGMPRDVMKRIFEPFTQADETVTRRFGGTGLGLAITKELVTLLGGLITVKSAPSAGSTFSIWVPARLEPAGIPGNAPQFQSVEAAA